MVMPQASSRHDCAEWRVGGLLFRVMPDLVDAIRQEIDARLEELRPLAREASDLQRALDALNGAPAAPTAGTRRTGRQPGLQPPF